MKKEDKTLKMSAAVATLAKNTKAYVLIQIDSNDKCDLMFDGSVYEILFMRETLTQFTTKFVNGEIKNES